jgi:hypothetical protein
MSQPVRTHREPTPRQDTGVIPRHGTDVVATHVGFYAMTTASAIQALHKLGEGQRFHDSALKSFRFVPNGCQERTVPIEPERCSRTDEIAGQVEHRGDTQPQEFGRDFRRIAALPVIEGHQAKRAFSCLGKALLQLTKLDEVKRTKKHLHMKARLL